MHCSSRLFQFDLPSALRSPKWLLSCFRQQFCAHYLFPPPFFLHVPPIACEDMNLFCWMKDFLGGILWIRRWTVVSSDGCLLRNSHLHRLLSKNLYSNAVELSTQCMYGFRTVLRIKIEKSIISLNIINEFVVVMEMNCVFFQARNKFVSACAIYMSSGLKWLNMLKEFFMSVFPPSPTHISCFYAVEQDPLLECEGRRGCLLISIIGRHSRTSASAAGRHTDLQTRHVGLQIHLDFSGPRLNANHPVVITARLSATSQH